MLAQDAMAHQLLKRTLSERQIAFLVMAYGPPEVFEAVAVPYYRANWDGLDADFALWACREICGQPQLAHMTVREWAARLGSSKSATHRRYMAIRSHLLDRIDECRRAAARELEKSGLISGVAA